MKSHMSKIMRGNIAVDKNYNFADLFAGAGGFTIGFKQAGYNPTKAVEFDSSIAETYKNAPLHLFWYFWPSMYLLSQLK